MNEDKKIMLSLPVERHEALKQRAKSQRQTMTALINRLLEDYLKTEDGSASTFERIEELEKRVEALTESVDALNLRLVSIENPRIMEIIERSKKKQAQANEDEKSND